jgi:hypothetical protein
VKAVKDVLAVYKAKLSGELARADTAELRADLEASAPAAYALGELRALASSVEGLPPFAALNVIKVYRLMPPGDISLVEALYERWLKARVKNRMAPGAVEPFKAELRCVVVEGAWRSGKTFALRAGMIRPRWWDSYIHKRYDDPAVDIDWDVAVDILDWRAKGVMPVVVDANPKAYKDSGLGADTLAEAMGEVKVPFYKKNMILRATFDKNAPLPSGKPPERTCVVGTLLKPEPHKKRVAYSGAMADRIAQSKTERAVSDTLSALPSFAVTKTGPEKDERFDKFSRPPVQVSGAGYLVALYYSFDVSGWSENMPGALQTASHEVWDEYFGGRDFRETSKNHVGATVTARSDGMKAWYINGDANFEGYNGKEMTAMHIAVMRVAVKKLRAAAAAAQIDVPSRALRVMLMAYIDDGVAKMTLPAVHARVLFQMFRDIVTTTWADHGLAIEPKKSFPSTSFFEFLAEAYLAGVHLAHGIKAAMRITVDGFDRTDTLPARIAKLSGSVRGMVSAGVKVTGAYMMLTVLCAEELRNWAVFKSPVLMTAFLLSPRSEGCLGLASIIAMDVNASGDAAMESYETLHAWARLNVTAKAYYVRMVRAGKIPRTALDVLTTPIGGTGKLPRMTKSLMTSRVRKALLAAKDAGKLSAIGNRLMDLDDPADAEAFARTVVPIGVKAVLQEQILVDARAGMPDVVCKAFIGRFDKYRTFMTICGRDSVSAVVTQARREAKASLDAVKARMGVS